MSQALPSGSLTTHTWRRNGPAGRAPSVPAAVGKRYVQLVCGSERRDRTRACPRQPLSRYASTASGSSRSGRWRRPCIHWSEARRLHGRGFEVRARQGIVQVQTRADPELGKHLLQVPLDGAGTEEQPGADLRIGKSGASELGDLPLVRRELIACLERALAHLLAGGEQLAAGALGERLHADRDEH